MNVDGTVDIVSERRVVLVNSQNPDWPPYATLDNNALSGLPNNVRFTFDAVTGEPKEVEIIK